MTRTLSSRQTFFAKVADAIAVLVRSLLDDESGWTDRDSLNRLNVIPTLEERGGVNLTWAGVVSTL